MFLGQDSLRYVGNQLLAAGTHVVEFWSEILQVKEEEVPDLSDSQTPAAGVDKEELSNVSPLPKVNFEEPDKELHSDSSLGQNAVVSNEESCWDKAELSSVLSFEIVQFNSSVEGETCKPLDVNAQVSSDLQANINSVVFDESCESKFSDSGVSSDDLSTFSIGKHSILFFFFGLFVSLFSFCNCWCQIFMLLTCLWILSCAMNL